MGARFQDIAVTRRAALSALGTDVCCARPGIDGVSLSPGLHRAAIEAPRLETSGSNIGEVLVIELFGDIASRTSAVLKDALLAPIAAGKQKLVVDFSAVRSVTRAGLGPFIIAAKLARCRGGDLRICRADAATSAMLSGLGHTHLIRVDRTLKDALAALSDRPRREEMTRSTAEALCQPALPPVRLT